MPLDSTALILIGYQNDYFAEDGILHSVIEDSARVASVLTKTVKLIREVGDEFGAVFATPIHFSSDYRALENPVGILKTIRDVGAFRAGTAGAEQVAEFREFSDLIATVPGKRGLNAFTHTALESRLRERGITNIVLAGAVTSICIDSTGRHASELGLGVTILSDCTTGRTLLEQDFYCSNVFPLYAEVTTSEQLIDGRQESPTLKAC